MNINNNSDKGGSVKGRTYTVADWLVGVASFSVYKPKPRYHGKNTRACAVV